MKSGKPSGAPPQHHFFHAMVLMGSTLALGCGGVVSRNVGSDSENGGAGADEAGGTESTGTGGAPSFGAGGKGVEIGGAFATGTGGLSSGGASGLFGTGGLYGAGGALPGLLPCVSAQWDCGVQQLGCDYATRSYEVLSGGVACTCDDSRPRSKADCKPGEAFVCESGSFDSDGGVAQVPFQCVCVAGATDCSACANDGYGQVCEVSRVSLDGRLPDILCGCAVVLLQ